MSNCNHDCASCHGSCRENAGVLELTQEEISMLENLGQFAFLPVAHRVDDPTPIYLEESTYTPEEYTLVIQLLEKKGLVSLDFDKPLRNFSDPKYASYPIAGSMALTERGQKVLQLLEIQGITPDVRD